MSQIQSDPVERMIEWLEVTDNRTGKETARYLREQRDSLARADSLIASLEHERATLVEALTKAREALADSGAAHYSIGMEFCHEVQISEWSLAANGRVNMAIAAVDAALALAEGHTK